MKQPTKAAIRCAQLETENTVLSLALSDAVNGDVTWFGRAPFRIGVSRPAGASGGIVIVNESETSSAHYWENWSREIMPHLNACITGADTEMNRELLTRRERIELAGAFIADQQKRRVA